MPESPAVPASEEQGKENLPNTPDLAAELEKERQARIKAEEIATNQKIRAEKAESQLKHATPQTPSQDGLSSKDVLFLSRVDIHADDLDDILAQARVHGGVQKAYDFMKPILDLRGEQRKTAAATQIKGASRPTPQDASSLLEKAAQGELPEGDDEIAKLTEARMQNRLKR